MKNNLTTTNQNAKLALIKSKSLLSITNSLLSKKANSNLEKQFKFRPFLIEEGHSKSVTALVVTPDGKTIISGSDDDTIKLWNMETGECLKTLKGHSGRIHSLAITLDGRQIISGSLMETKIWDLQSGKCLKNIKQQEAASYSYTNDDYIASFQVISSDGNTTASINYYKEIRVWNKENCNRIHRFYASVGSTPILTISPNGNIVAAGKGELHEYGKIEIWDIEKNKCIHKLKKHTNLVSAIVITPDNNKLVSGSWDKTIRIWDIKSGECLKVLEGHNNFVKTLAVTPDGNTLVSSSVNPNIIKIWDLSTGKCLNTIETSARDALAITPDGNNLVTEYGIWSLETGKCIKKLKSSSSSYEKILAIPTNEKEGIFTSDEYIKYNELNLYDNENNFLKTLKKQDNWIQILKIAPTIKKIADENHLINDFMGTHVLKLWDKQNDKCILTFDSKNDITIDSQGYFNASDENIENYIRVSESPLSQRKLTKQEISHFRQKNDYFETEDLCIEKKENLHINNSDSSMCSYIEPILITSDRKTLVTAHGDSTLKIWDTQTGKCLKSLEGHTGFPETIAITPDGKTIITSIVRDAYDGYEVEENYIGDDGEEYINTHVEYEDEYEENFELLLWDLKNGNYLGSLNSHISSVNTLSISSDGKTLVSGSSHDKAYENSDNINYGVMDYEIILWDIQNMKKIRTFYGEDGFGRFHTHNDSINILEYTPNGKIIVSGSDDFTIKSWDIETGKCLNTFKGHCGCINTLTITPDSKTIISGSDDYTIKLWDIESGKCFNTFMGHTNEVRSLQLTPDGKNIIVVSKKNIIKILDVKNGKCLKTIEDYNSSNFLLTISSDGNITILKKNDQTVDIFDLYTESKLYTINCNINYDSIDKSIRVTEKPVEDNINESQIPQIDIDEDEIPF